MNEIEKDEYIAQLESIIAMMPGLVFWKSKEGKFLGCNNNEVKTFKLKSREEFIGKTTEELVGKKLAPALLANDEYVMRTGEEYCCEEIGVSLNEEGEGIYLTTKSPLKNFQDEIIGVVGISIDITERKKMEEELKRTQAELRETSTRLEEILALIPGHIYWKDTQGHYLGCNAAFAKTLNLPSRTAIIGKSDLDFIEPHLAKPVIDFDQDVIKSNTEKSTEELAIDQHGNSAIYFSQKAPLKNAASETIGLVGISFDITERKKAEQELQQTKQQLQKALEEKSKFINNMTYMENILSELPGNVFWTDTNYRYLGCNDNVVKLFKLKTREEFIGKTLYDLTSKEFADKILETDKRVLATGVAEATEEEAFDFEGNLAIYLTRKAPLFDENGKVIGLLGLALDITERKEMEKALEEAKQKAEAANKAKSEFLAMVSHELRIPLTGILGMAQLLDTDETLNAEQHEGAQDIIRSGDHLLSLVDDLLDVTKLEAGKIELHYAQVDLKKLVEEISTMLLSRAKQKNIELYVDYPESIPNYVITDAKAIRQILLNLVGNAIKFTQAGYVKIKIDCMQRKGDEVTLALSVEDTGIGIADDKLENIFERFNQADISITRQYGGTGLGLTITKSYLHLMEGHINVKSKINKGSVFSCVIPFKLATNHNTLSPWESYKTNIRILVVSDNLYAEVIAKHISSSLCEVVSSDQAISKLLASQTSIKKIDILIVDKQIPETILDRLVQVINKHSSAPILLLLLTDENSPAYKTLAKTKGFYDCLTKPAGPNELLVNLTSIWEKWSESLSQIEKS